MLTGDPNEDTNNPINDPNDPAYGYKPIDVSVKPMPEWNMPQVNPTTCPAYGTSSRNVNGNCRWPGTYQVPTISSPAAITGARVHVAGDMNIGESSTLTVAESTVRVDGKMTLGGASVSNFYNSEFFVAKNVAIGESNKSAFHGPTAIAARGNLSLGGAGRLEFFDDATFFVGGDMSIGGSGVLVFHDDVVAFVDGDLTISGSGTLTFNGSATFYVAGSVKIQGSGWTRGSGGSNTPWIVFYVRKGVEISGAAGAGSSIPDAAFLLDTEPAYSQYAVTLTGSASLYGGVYAPTRVIRVQGTSPVTGSLIGKTLEIPSWRQEKEFRDKYDQHAERMRSFHLPSRTRTRGSEQLLEWREVEPWAID